MEATRIATRIATYYLTDGREIDVYRSDEDYHVQDGYLTDDKGHDFSHFPTWYEVDNIYRSKNDSIL